MCSDFSVLFLILIIYYHDLMLFQLEAKEIYCLHSNQEETDASIVIYLHSDERLGFKSTVVPWPDSDIFFILLLHTHEISITIYFDIGMGKHRLLIAISELSDELGNNWCSTLHGFYVFSGEDCSNAFKDKGKVTPLR